MNGHGPKVRCDIELTFPDHESATKIHASVELDNDGYVVSQVEGAVVKAHIEAESLNSLLHSLDDFLSCVSVAEKMVGRR
jgi:tRNA threonylcarbamoyladenosine modification (KEOPS) complex  Pcc1 subunit